MRSRALNLAALAFLVGLFESIGGGFGPAAAQQLDAGKPPAQIFNGTCSACHRSPRGLVRSVSAGALPGFLRQH
jgi:mono/diheme cytochrome c family protein